MAELRNLHQASQAELIPMNGGELLIAFEQHAQCLAEKAADGRPG
jgi:hypothetical protein